MSKKKKKIRPNSTAQQQAEIQGQTSGVQEQRSQPKGHKPEIGIQFSEIESKWRNMDDRTWFRAACWITALAAFLRFFMLLLRPVHHDEGVNGWMLTNLIRDNVYKYDPSNYHGPTIYFMAFPLIKLFGLETMPIRSLSSFFGLLMVVMVFWLRRYLGNLGTLIAAFLVAISPGLVFVSRYFIHEIFFVFFSLCIVVSVLYFIEKRKAGPFAIGWMSVLLIVCFLPGALLGGKYLGGENETAVAGLRFVLFLVDAAIVWSLMKFLVSWDEGRPIYFLLASASVALLFATKETAFITIGTMAIALPCVWLWEKIGPGKTLKKTLQRNALIGTGLVAATALYYYPNVADGFKYLYTEFLNNSYRPQDPFLFYSLMLLMAVTLVVWFIYVADLKTENISAFEQPEELSWKTFRQALGTNKNAAMIFGAAAIFFWYLIVLFFTSFFSYKEGVGKAFEAYDIWTKTGTKEHSQNGTWAYMKWGMKGENAIIFGSLLGTLVAFIKGRHRFAMFTGLWAAGLFAAYMIIPYKTPWLALNYVLPMCLIAGYGLSEFILSKNRSLNLAAYAMLAVGTVVLGYQTYQSNWVRYDDDQMPYVYAHTRRGFVDMINQIDHYKDKSNKGLEEFVIDVTSPDYWPMTWYVVNYKHVGYHGHIIDSTGDVIVTKKKDQDTEAMAKYADKYKYVGMYPLRPGVDLNLLVRNDLADPPCTGPPVQYPVYNTEHCTHEISVIPSVPLTP